MSGLRPERAPKRTSVGNSELVGHAPGHLWRKTHGKRLRGGNAAHRRRCRAGADRL